MTANTATAASPMKIGIDSYSYHRWFGEYYKGLQVDPCERISIWDFLDRASAYGLSRASRVGD